MFPSSAKLQYPYRGSFLFMVFLNLTRLSYCDLVLLPLLAVLLPFVVLVIPPGSARLYVCCWPSEPVGVLVVLTLRDMTSLKIGGKDSGGLWSARLAPLAWVAHVLGKSQGTSRWGLCTRIRTSYTSYSFLHFLRIFPFLKLHLLLKILDTVLNWYF